MKFGVIVFPGSNCDHDAYHVISKHVGQPVDFIWHRDIDLSTYDAVIIPGGFSYGDYLRAGALARFSPVMNSIREFAAKGNLVLGICNGFQILCEAGLLPGALVRNRSLHFVCDMVTTRVEVAETPFTRGMPVGALLRLPVAHGEGCYYADEGTLRELNERQQVLLRYCDAQGETTAASNPNGSIENIAGICNRARNVFGLMPHPDRACEERLGSGDGARIFESMLQTLASDRAAA